ncbi:DNA polymerase Y family protein [Ruania halotolerans]|uniref:DNA polymerase Y family protein n=1 Tax=Ruania halotolerans TaxID=2897773 RepID=UPI001E5ACF77|nr:DNA polymerase Y family protein [Ruania halotolerans]UFU05000.1 DNA polymerase Y family protein [Ruania halotolerans]
MSAAVPESRPAIPQRSVQNEAATRLAVLWVPDWPVAAAVIEGVVSAHEPVAIHDARGIVAASARARAEGVRRGMRRRSAQALCPELILVPIDEGRDVRAFEPVVQAVEEEVPQVQVTRPGMVVLAAGGPSRYLGSEEAVAEALIDAAADAGAEAQVGIADGQLAALLAARESVIVSPGRSAAFLTDRDIRDLVHVTTTRQARAEMTEFTGVLRRLGIFTLGGLAAMRSGQVASRFGSLGDRARRLALGLDGAPPSGRRGEPELTSAAELDPPAGRMDTAAFAARRLAEDLQGRMMRRGVLCGRLRVRVRTEDGAELVRTWRIEGALTAAELTDRVRWQLDGWLSGRSGRAPSAALTHLEITAEEVSPAATVAEGLWGRVGRGERQAGRAALRVQGMLGEDGVLAPVLEGGRAPRDRVRLVAWGDEVSPLRDPNAPWPGQIPRPLPATVPAQPIPARVLDAAGEPVHVDARGTLSGRPARVEVAIPEVPGRFTVSRWAGPWPVHERWWTGGRPRHYLQVVGERGSALLLAGDGEQWWAEGIYD